MADTYEVEVKTLLGSTEAADALRARLKELDPACALRSSHTQLNHYFEGGDIATLVASLEDKVSEETKAKMERIANDGKNISVRTREMNGEAKIVMKASVGDDSSSNGVARLEVEETVPDMTLTELDQILLDAGYAYQAKWSREREEYVSGPFSVCLDKNAGYGYLAEIERVVDSPEAIEGARREIDAFMQELGVSELPQDRLERMFAHYNQNWPQYYGTNNIFVID
jgi:predicted adenylyl cyclase CyaB